MASSLAGDKAELVEVKPPMSLAKGGQSVIKSTTLQLPQKEKLETCKLKNVPKSEELKRGEIERIVEQPAEATSVDGTLRLENPK